jgi:large subunit ribosomal protein L25
MNDVLITCLPKDLPEFIEVDLASLAVGQSVHVRDISFPAGVTPVLHEGENPTIVTTSAPGGASADDAAEAAPAAAAPAAGDAKPAA